jgi:hypothetical protein
MISDCRASVFGVKEGDCTVSDVSKELMELFLSIESVALVEGGVVIANMLEELLVEVMTEGRDHEYHTSNQSERF